MVNVAGSDNMNAGMFHGECAGPVKAAGNRINLGAVQ